MLEVRRADPEMRGGAGAAGRFGGGGRISIDMIRNHLTRLTGKPSL